MSSSITVGARVVITGGSHVGWTGTVTNRYPIRFGHMMNDITISPYYTAKYYSDSQLELITED